MCGCFFGSTPVFKAHFVSSISPHHTSSTFALRCLSILSWHCLIEQLFSALFVSQLSQHGSIWEINSENHRESLHLIEKPQQLLDRLDNLSSAASNQTPESPLLLPNSRWLSAQKCVAFLLGDSCLLRIYCQSIQSFRWEHKPEAHNKISISQLFIICFFNLFLCFLK